ncbi:MAG: hypothetical protein JW913_10830, partial [Chitinispirillaceae bacterium]|nr:hypothetical protein [Chitinispirillaceae bacterium]
MRFLVMVLVPFVAYAQMGTITTKSGSFHFNTRIDLTTGEYSNTEVEVSLEGQLDYLCSTGDEEKDFFVNAFYYPSLAICPSRTGAIGSVRPFYRFKKGLDSMNLDNPLNLDNPKLFTKVDTVAVDTLHGEEFSSSCTFPRFVWEQNSDTIILVVTTSGNKYALVILYPIYGSRTCGYWTGDSSVHWTETELNGFNATWYIQESGWPLFKGIDLSTGVVHNQYRRYPKA